MRKGIQHKRASLYVRIFYKRKRTGSNAVEFESPLGFCFIRMLQPLGLSGYC